MSKYVLIAFDFRGRMEIIRFMFAATGVKVRREKNLHFVQNSTVKFSQPCVFDYFLCNKSSMLRNGHLPVSDPREICRIGTLPTRNHGSAPFARYHYCKNINKTRFISACLSVLHLFHSKAKMS